MRRRRVEIFCESILYLPICIIITITLRMNRAFRCIPEDPTNVLELTLQGLVEPLNHRLFRQKVIGAGGVEQVYHLCKKWTELKCGPEEDEKEDLEPKFPLETLQIVNNLSLDKDVCETFYELGMVKVFCDVFDLCESQPPCSSLLADYTIVASRIISYGSYAASTAS